VSGCNEACVNNKGFCFFEEKKKNTNPTLMAISSVPKPSNLASGIIASIHVVKMAASWFGVTKWRIQEIGIKMRSTLSPVFFFFFGKNERISLV